MESFVTRFIQTPTGVTILIAAIMSVVEVSKIQINPWSWVGMYLQKLIGVRDVA